MSDKNYTKTEIILRRVIIGVFSFITLAGVFFALATDAPMMPAAGQKTYVLEQDGKRVSCLFPLFSKCLEKDISSE